ncbi:MAG: hypothetical protein CO187_05335 [Zetaproteobacteria bacterium CG_4_9_14_3_um_filter_53_7]|nr:MAG: hypothetical protein CO187_05335 [Zetaproteobacteria bacterium CG_4_9_14_3_um_filter_53_7]
MVLKVRYGRVAHFKKFAVFLEPPKSIQTAAEKPPVATVQLTEQNAVAAQPATSADDSATADGSAADEKAGAFDGWARTDRYGPIVYGDVLSTVAGRLRVDTRYRPYQVMVALYEKNKTKFDNDNMNLLKAGSFLQVPTAAEIEQRSAKDAYKLFAQHEKQWKELTEKPRYAAVEEAQRSRYAKRVSVGEQASGSAAAPVLMPASTENRTVAGAVTPATATDSGAPADSEGVQSLIPQATDQQALATAEQAASAPNAEVAELKAKNEALQQQLLENQKSIEALNSKMDEVAAAASTARVDKLEVLLVRLQAELEKANKQAVAPQYGPDWVVWLLAALVIILLGAVAVLMRREPAHPADESVRMEEAVVEPVVDELLMTGDSEAADEPEESEEDVFDSIASFADDLTDTDTAEMEPFDASLLDEDPDPNVDYLSEADVYARYGMDDEALHQLNLALRLQPDNLAAHVKKAQLLRRTGAMEAFSESKADAERVLESADLEKFYAQLHEAPVGRTAVPDEQASAVAPAVVAAATGLALSDDDDDVSGVMLVDASEDDGIDFDISDVEMPDHHDEVSPEPAMEEMDWLHDDSFDATVATAVAEEPVTASDESHDATGATVTQMFDNLMVEFSEDEDVESPALAASVTSEPAELDFEATLDLESSDATQELDNLLSEFTNQDEELTDDAVTVADAAASDRTLVIEDEMSDLQHLDHLLGDFADDDNMFNFSPDSDELDASVFDQAEAALLRQGEGDESALGATQHLDILMNEFAEPAESEADESAVAENETAGLDDDLLEQNGSDTVAVGIDAGHDTTQELSHLLSAFSDDDGSLETAEYETSTAEVDHDATQELDHLLSEFALTEEDDDPELEVGDHGTTQELGHLLSEFSFDEDDAYEPEADTAVRKDSGFAANHSATQELDQLLSEFSDDEDDDNKKS